MRRERHERIADLVREMLGHRFAPAAGSDASISSRMRALVLGHVFDQ